GGCFWGVEAVFDALSGVERAVSGYAGGEERSANYEMVCTGKSGHAEAVEITYDPSVISLRRLLEVYFFVAHDPTQLNRQGHDVGPQYRSAIFYRTDEQKAIAQAYVSELEKTNAFPK